MADSYDPTIKYDNSDSNNPESPIDQTIAYAGSESGAVYSGQQFKNGDTIVLNGVTYTIRGNLSENRMSGEAVVYKVQDSEGQILALKLYYSFNNPMDEPNNEALRRIKRIEDPDILNVYDYGTGNRKYRGENCFEICQYAPGGDLLAVSEGQFKKKYNPEFVTKEVIPQIFKGMCVLHKNKIFHGDLKPHNVFYLDKAQTDLVIGDYGSAKTYSKNSHKSLAFTFMAKGTSFYLAPEQARGIISEKNDYYSLGMILVHLLYPQFVNQESLVKIVERQFAKKPIIDFDPALGRLNDLIAGLTLQEIGQRWGRSEVEQWMQGGAPSIAYASVAPIKLGDATLRNPDELVAYMTSQKKWYQDLIADRQGFNMLLDWITRLQDLAHKKEFEARVAYYKKDGRPFTEVAVLRYFKPSYEVDIAGVKVDFFDGGDPAATVKKVFSLIDMRWKSSSLDQVRTWILDIEFCLRHLARTAQESTRQRVKIILEKVAAALHLPTSRVSGYHYTFHRNITFKKLVNLLNAFLPERKFLDEKGNEISNGHQLGLFLARDPHRFYDERIIPDMLALAEKEAIPGFENMNYQACLYACLGKEVTTQLRLDQMRTFSPDLDTPSRYVVTFSMTRSLTDFLASQGIDPEIMREKQKGKKKKQPQQAIGHTLTNLNIDLDDGSDEAVVAQFWEIYERRYPIGGGKGAPVTQKQRESFQANLLSRLSGLREMRRQAEKQRAREQKKLILKAAVVAPLGFLPILLVGVLFAAEFLNIFTVKKMVRSLYLFGDYPLDVRLGGMWDMLFMYINWNILYSIAALPAGLLFQLWERDNSLKRPMLFSLAPPLVFFTIGVGVSLMFGVGFPLFMLLGGGLQRVPVIGSIVIGLLLLTMLKKTVYNASDYIRAGYGINRRRRDRASGRRLSNYFRTTLRCDSFRFIGGRSLTGMLLLLILCTFLVFSVAKKTTFARIALKRSLNKINSPVGTFGFTRFGDCLLVGYGDGRVRAFDTQTGKLQYSMRIHRSAIRSLAISSTGDRAATGSQWGFMHVWDPGDGKVVRRYQRVRYLHNGPITGLEYDSSGTILASGGNNGLIRFWKPSKKRRYSYRYVRAFPPVCISRDIDWMVTRNKYGALTLWKISLPISGGYRYKYKYKRSFVIRRAGITKAIFSPDDRFVAAASTDGRVHVWDRATGKAMLKLRGSNSQATALKYSRCGRYLAAGFRDGVVALFDIKSGQTLQAGYMHDSTVQDLDFSNDSHYLLSGDSRGRFEFTKVLSKTMSSSVIDKGN